MAKRTVRLAIFRLSSSPKWLSTSATATATATARGDQEENVLHKILAIAGADVKVGDTLDDWAKQGKKIKKTDLISAVDILRQTKRHRKAVEVYQWIQKSKTKMNNEDHVKHLDLIVQTEGVASAEKYFHSLRDSAKTQKTYGALLRWYCFQNMFDNAVELFEKMKELNFGSSLNYNHMMHLYTSVGQPHKALSLSKEMEDRKIPADVYTYNKLMKIYASLRDYDAVDGIIEKMEANKVKCDWFTYANLATIYVNAGFVDKADAALRNLEDMANLRDLIGFHTLITSYAQTSNLSGVYRAWESLKAKRPTTNNFSYEIMLLALSKLGDYDGLEKSFREWESSCSVYDVRVSNVILESYLNRDMIDEANRLYQGIEESGVKPNSKTLNLFTNFYVERNRMDLAVKYFEIGASTMGDEADKNSVKYFEIGASTMGDEADKNSFLTDETVDKFMKYFEEKKDVESGERFFECMKKLCRVDAKVYDSLIRTYIAAGKDEPGMRQRLKEDGIEIGRETERLLCKLCSD